MSKVNGKEQDKFMLGIDTCKTFLYWRDIMLNIFVWDKLEMFPLLCSQDIERILFENGAAVVSKYKAPKVAEVLAIGELNNAYNQDLYKRPLIYGCTYGNGRQQGGLSPADSVIIYNRYEGKPTLPYLTEYVADAEYCKRSIYINMFWQNLNAVIGTDSKNLLSVKNLINEKEQGIVASYVDTELITAIKIDKIAPEFIADRLIDVYNWYESFILRFIGLDYNSVDKAERVNVVEANANAGVIEANKMSMLAYRKQAADKINKIFGTSVTVEYNHEIIKELAQRGTANNGTVHNDTTGSERSGGNI